MTIIYYYLFILTSSFFYFLNKKLGAFIVIFIVFFSLFYLVSGPPDYEGYKLDYESGYFSTSWPFFYTSSGITAEASYKIYSGFLKIVTDASFSGYLSLNFAICVFVFFFFTPFKGRRSKNINYLFWLFLLPVIIPTIFYFSPRSSISFFLVLAGFFLIMKGRGFSGRILMVFGSFFHFQFLPVVFFLFFCSFFLRGDLINRKRKLYSMLLVISLFLIVFLKFSTSLVGLLSGAFTMLPASDYLVTKIGYLNRAPEGIRITAILSLFVFPVLLYLLHSRQLKLTHRFEFEDSFRRNFLFLSTVVVLFGFCVNLAFFDQPHISGRLSRFSDYYSLGIVLPVSLLLFFSWRVVVLTAIILIFSAPVLYSTVYAIH